MNTLCRRVYISLVNPRPANLLKIEEIPNQNTSPAVRTMSPQRHKFSTPVLVTQITLITSLTFGKQKGGSLLLFKSYQLYKSSTL